MKSFAKHPLLFFLILICINSTTLLAAKHDSPIKIFTGGYIFTSSYKLHPASIDIPSSDLIVDVYATRSTFSIGKKIYPGVYQVGLKYTVDGVLSTLKAYPSKNGYHQINKTNISHSSIWYPCLKKVLSRVARYDGAFQTKKICYADANKLKTSFPGRISALPGGKLHTTYLLKKNSSSMPQGITVDFVTELEIAKRHTDKPRLIVVATFHTKKGTQLKSNSAQAIIKFVETEKGLQEISRKHTKRSSLWYSSIKKIAKKSMRQYYRFKKLHEQKISKYAFIKASSNEISHFRNRRK